MLKAVKTFPSIKSVANVFKRAKSDASTLKISPIPLKLKDPSLAEINHIQIKNSKHLKPKRGLDDSEVPIPVSPLIGPYHVTTLKLSEKKYRWCSCGMALKQPFCDSSCKGTNFKPLRFTIEEKAESIDLCGCKYTKSPPYCDAETCVHLKKSEI